MAYQQHIPAPADLTRFDTAGSWHDYVNQHFPTLEMSAQPTEAGFHVRANHCRLGDCGLTHIDTSAYRVDRTPALARRAPDGYLKIMWQLAGHMRLSQDRRSVHLRAGQVSVCDTARAYRLHLNEGARFAVLLVPHALDSRLPRYAEQLSATNLGDVSAMQAILGAIMGLTRSRPHPDDPGVGDVMNSVGGMLAATLARAANTADDAVDAQRMQRAHDFIAAHMASADLTPQRLADALCVSRRTLYALLARHGTTPAQLIKTTRLRHAGNVLARSASGTDSITDIALAHGFCDAARFSHAFKDQFGEAPSHWRARRRG